MFAGTALSVRLFVCAGLSLFIICGPYLSVVVCVFYAYNLTGVCLSTIGLMDTGSLLSLDTAWSVCILLECFLVLHHIICFLFS